MGARTRPRVRSARAASAVGVRFSRIGITDPTVRRALPGLIDWRDGEEERSGDAGDRGAAGRGDRVPRARVRPRSARGVLRGEAAEALGHDPARVFKTLVIGDGKQLAVAIVPTSGKLSLKAAGAALGLHRPAMADPADVRRVTGYVLGGVSPLGQRKRLPTAIDESALGFETVFCSAGRRGLEVEVAPSDLVAATSATVAPLAAP